MAGSYLALRQRAVESLVGRLEKTHGNLFSCYILEDFNKPESAHFRVVLEFLEEGRIRHMWADIGLAELQDLADGHLDSLVVSVSESTGV